MSNPRIQRSKLFKKWYLSLTEKEKNVVDARIDTYRENKLLIGSKLLDSTYCLYEFKWKSGLRVYYCLIEDTDGKLMLLLLGGNKNSQQRDITEAKNMIRKVILKINSKKSI